MYVPKRIQSNFELSKEKHGANIIVEGTIFCCGQYAFNISYFGELINNYICSGDDNKVILTAKCYKCGREILVFNSLTDGYDGCLNCENVYDAQRSHELMSFSCPKCSKGSFSVKITFEYQPKKYLEADGIQNYENAFSWIWISVICLSCKKKMNNLIDTETS